MISHQALRLAFVTCLTLAGASATSITYSGDDPNRSFDIWFSAAYQTGDTFLNGQPAPSPQTIDVNVTAGIANLLIDGLYTVDAVCVDFFVLISNGVYDVNLLGPNAVGGGTRVAWMLRNTLPTINTQVDPLLKRQQAAAFQLAVWDVVHDGGDGFASGRIQSSQSTPTDSIVLTWANTFLGDSAGHTVLGGTVYQNVNGPLTSQRLMSDTVPEPSTYAMLLGGGALLGLYRRRRAA